LFKISEVRAFGGNGFLGDDRPFLRLLRPQASRWGKIEQQKRDAQDTGYDGAQKPSPSFRSVNR
jgi:hypothetical protein